jgi:rhodanese-related sulfurtransferase
MARALFFFLLLIYSCQIFDSSEINVISDTQLIEIQDNDYILVDVRTIEEYESGHIQDAFNFDFYSESFQKEILSLDKSSSIILYCRTQNRSTKTANYLKENGYKEITVLEGGITSWVKNGNDLVYNFSDDANSIKD